MNRYESDILKALAEAPYVNQRTLAEVSGHSLGIVNRSLKDLVDRGFADKEMNLTFSSKAILKTKAPRNAIILAAGFGMRMVPINLEVSKGLLEVKGEILIERIIRQLHEAGIYNIYIVVGFMKEQYEYLIDKYQVELIANPDYKTKNNLYSLEKSLEHLSNAYIVPCDIWCKYNPFNKYELYSWYMISEIERKKSPIRVNKKKELVATRKGESGHTMIGISYLDEETSAIARNTIRQLCNEEDTDDFFWEEALFQTDRVVVQAKIVNFEDIIEINTYEQLRDLDSNSSQLKSDAIEVISNVLMTEQKNITGITILKKGMTNRSFLFECMGKKYIMRIPGEGTAQLIDRQKEAEIYRVLQGKGICNDCIYINAQNGYKITGFLENSRACDPQSLKDVKRCMEKLRNFHKMELHVSHEFDIFEQIDFYESLWEDEISIYRDHADTKKKVLSLKLYVESHISHKVLTHIDAVPDNFLFTKEKSGNESIYLIDWEYAGMQDPHVDIAMFGIYSFYTKKQMDDLIQTYFEGKCDDDVRIKIYCYVAICGLLWSDWCEYKRKLGVDFGEYSLRQYRYAKEYYRIVVDELGKDGEKWGIK